MIPETRQSTRVLPVVGVLIVMLVLSSLLSAALVQAQAGPPVDPAATPQATATAPSTEELPPEARAALDAYLAAQSARSDVQVEPVEIESHFTHVYLPLSVSNRATTPPPTPTPDRTTRVAAAIWPSPSIRVARDGTLAYEIRAWNDGNYGASGVKVMLPYTSQHMIVTGSRIPNTKDWVSEVTNSRVVVTFGPLNAGETRTATILFRVGKTLPDNTVINMRAAYTWSDDSRGGSWSSNWTPLLVGSGNDSAPWLWMTVTPTAGLVGTTHRFYSDRFLPGEEVVTWLNTPSGVKGTGLRGTASNMGVAQLDFKSTGLPRGNYQMVVYGMRSKLTAIANFVVQ